jgi:hypothetical protein
VIPVSGGATASIDEAIVPVWKNLPRVVWVEGDYTPQPEDRRP